MGKQVSPRSPRPNLPKLDSFLRINEHQSRSAESRRASGGDCIWDNAVLAKGSRNDTSKGVSSKRVFPGKRHARWLHMHVGSIIFACSLMGFVFILGYPAYLDNIRAPRNEHAPKEENAANEDREKSAVMYPRLLHMASVSLAERELEQKESKFWKETNMQASMWRPCADKKVKRAETAKNNNGHILVSTNGGLNQQRVAVCNAVAVASLLNATLVIPKFLYSNVWKDPSQFDEIYQEDTFIEMLKKDVDIVKDLPENLKLSDLEAIGSVVTDADLSKEATPNEYIKRVLPILLRNKIVHFLGFGNRLGFEGLPYDLQRLRCKCNFHALKFAPKIQKTGSLLINRIRRYGKARSSLDEQLLGSFVSSDPYEEHIETSRPLKYLALHLRFEVDMVAYSMCDFGGGRNEARELRAYREEHFPLVLERLKKTKPLSPEELRKMGRCPLTPEEEALVLAGLGFDGGTYIYLAGSEIYGGKSRMRPLNSLYPNIVTKEDLLSPYELAPFRNFSSQLAALDLIACAVADVFAMTDSGSQLSSLVSGFRSYYGGGKAATLRPIKMRLAAILRQNGMLRWHDFESRIRKMVEEGQRVQIRGSNRSIYRQPRCKECMCKV